MGNALPLSEVRNVNLCNWKEPVKNYTKPKINHRETSHQRAQKGPSKLEYWTILNFVENCEMNSKSKT